MTDANHHVEVLWRGQFLIGSIIDRFRRDLGLETCEALDELVMVMQEIRIDKAHRISQRRRAKAKKRTATGHYSLAD